VYDLTGKTAQEPWFDAMRQLREWTKFVRLFYAANGWSLNEIKDVRFALLKCRSLDGHFYYMPDYLLELCAGHHPRGKPGTWFDTAVFNQIFFGFHRLRTLPGRGVRRRFAQKVEPAADDDGESSEETSKDKGEETSKAKGEETSKAKGEETSKAKGEKRSTRSLCIQLHFES
jgi:hypothetical protein